MCQRDYMDSNIENQLTMILSDLNKVEGIDSSLIADSNGAVICHTMSRRTDTSLFGHMAHVITSSSKRLLNSANGGEIQRVLVESHGGKALFLHLENTYFIVLMEISANVGLVMVSAKRAAKDIIKLTKDMVPAAPVEEEVIATQDEVEAPSEEITTPDETEVPSEEIETAVIGNEIAEKQDEIEVEELNVETVDKIIETEDLEQAAAKVIGTEKLDEILESEEFKVLNDSEAKEKLSEMLEIETEEESLDMKSPAPEAVKEPETVDKADVLLEESSELEIEAESRPEEIEEPESSLPVIKPPISFPKLPEGVEIPTGDKEKSDLILDIYEAIFLAMSIGASKIMGVSPARGLIKQFLPLEDCKSLLKDVDVKSNSVVDFNKIRENAESIPLNDRENTLITDFSKIITIITENYGKIMGYGAFRGIVRTEFKIINNSYGKTMDELGIKDKIHPELIDLFK